MNNVMQSIAYVMSNLMFWSMSIRRITSTVLSIKNPLNKIKSFEVRYLFEKNTLFKYINNIESNVWFCLFYAYWLIGGLIISHLNELGHILELDKQYFDAQSKIILSFKSVQTVLLQQCLDKCKHLSLQETLLWFSQSHPFQDERCILIRIEAQDEESYTYRLLRRGL